MGQGFGSWCHRTSDRLREREGIRSSRERETETLRYGAGGNSNRQIPEALNASARTLRNYIIRILAKLNANNRADAAALAMEALSILLDDAKSRGAALQ